MSHEPAHDVDDGSRLPGEPPRHVAALAAAVVLISLVIALVWGWQRFTGLAEPYAALIFAGSSGGTPTPSTTGAGTGGAGQPRGGPVVPNAVGLDQAAAQTLLTTAGLRPRIRLTPSDEPMGVVVDQQPAAGSRVTTGSAVRLRVSAGPSVPDVTVELTDDGVAVRADRPVVELTAGGSVRVRFASTVRCRVGTTAADDLTVVEGDLELVDGESVTLMAPAQGRLPLLCPDLGTLGGKETAGTVTIDVTDAATDDTVDVGWRFDGALVLAEPPPEQPPPPVVPGARIVATFRAEQVCDLGTTTGPAPPFPEGSGLAIGNDLVLTPPVGVYELRCLNLGRSEPFLVRISG